jgi:hypothetical protein
MVPIIWHFKNVIKLIVTYYMALKQCDQTHTTFG